MTEGIIEQEDREFNSSIGNWTGDPTWEYGPIHGSYGQMNFTLQPYGPNQVATLAYPYFKIPNRADYFYIFLNHIMELSVLGNPYLEITAQDGEGNIIIIEPQLFIAHLWTGHTVYFTPPLQWQKTSGKLIFTLHSPDQAEGNVYFDNLSAFYFPFKVQYLPILGVG